MKKAAAEVIPYNEASIWFCSKEMQMSKKLSDYLGKNEKSKVIVKIQKVNFLNLILILLLVVSLRVCVFFLRKVKVHRVENL